MLAPIFIALVLALIAALLWRARAKGGLPVLAIAWSLYAGYEFLMYRRILCTGECNIRVDLLLLYPVLLGAAIWQAVSFAIHRYKRARRAIDDA